MDDVQAAFIAAANMSPGFGPFVVTTRAQDIYREMQLFRVALARADTDEEKSSD